MKKLSYNLYATAAGKAENQDNNNLYVNGTFDGDRIVSIDSIEDRDGNKLTPEVIGTMKMVDTTKVDIDFLKAVTNGVVANVEVDYNGGEETGTIDIPIDVILQGCAEQNLSGNLCTVVITEQFVNQVVYIDIDGANINYRYSNPDKYIPDVNDNWFYSFSSLVEEQALNPYYLPILKEKYPNADSIEGVQCLTEGGIVHSNSSIQNTLFDAKITK